jgi:dipeptidyl-peptidase 4
MSGRTVTPPDNDIPVIVERVYEDISNPYLLQMPDNRFFFLAVLFIGLLIVPRHAVGQEEVTRPSLTLEDINASRMFSGQFFSGGRWADEGPIVRFTREDKSGSNTDLISYDLEKDSRTILIDGSELYAPDVERNIRIDDYAFSEDGSRILIYTDSERLWRLPTQGYYYVYEPETGKLTPLSDRSRGFQMFAKFNSAGDEVAFVRGRNLFLVSLDDMSERALTTDGAQGSIINGTFDWVYEEEFGLRDGWKWSPDGRNIAFFKLDESATRDFAMTDLRGLYPEYERFRYPKAGMHNSEVKVGLLDLEDDSISYFDTDTWNSDGEEHEYIARMGWTPAVDGSYRVWMLRLNRDQNRLDLLYGDAETGSTSRVLHEEEPTWIDLGADKITYLDDGKHFVWQSETSGFNHLYLYENSGLQVGALTSGEWDVTNFHGVDLESGTAYFTAAVDNPLERGLYSIKVDTRGADSRRPASVPLEISGSGGTHRINMSSDFRYYVDAYSDVSTPPVWTLHSSDGRVLRNLEPNSELIERLKKYDLPAPEFTSVPAADSTPLNAYLIKPSDFDSTRQYPLLMYVYGGPGSQTVTNGWGGSRYLFHSYLADKLGIVVASVDNRGTGGRGKTFKSATYRRLGELEASDQIAAAEYLGKLPFIDADRVGIWGWSYGGYMTLMSMLSGKGPRTFSLGVSVAPVTDWRLYDTIYTERYMSTPQSNRDGYRNSAPLNLANRLDDRQRLLIVHGDFDDNVHFQNSVQMIDALQSANKQFSFMMYPGRNHGISGGVTRLNLFTKVTNYIRDNL